MLPNDIILTIWTKWLGTKDRIALSSVNILFHNMKVNIGWLSHLTVKPRNTKFTHISDIDYCRLLTRHYRSLHELNVYNAIDDVNRLPITLPNILRIVYTRELFPIVIDPVNVSSTCSISIVSNTKDTVDIYVNWDKFPHLQNIYISAYDLVATFIESVPDDIKIYLLLKNTGTLCHEIDRRHYNYFISEYI